MTLTFRPMPALRRRRLPRGVAFAAFTVVVIAALWPGARAAFAVPQQQQAVNSWALAPTGSDPSQPGSRSNLSYDLAPGAVVEDSVTLWNYSNVPLTFDVYATDAINTETGDFTLRQAGIASTDVGAWVTLGTGNITLPAATSVQIPMTLRVPTDASPGDHTAGVIATSKTPAVDGAGNQVVLDRRVGTRLYLRVAGPVNPGLEVEDLRATYHGGVSPLDGRVDVSYRVHNTGNVRLGTDQIVAVSDLFGVAATTKPAPIVELLPGNSVVVHVELTGVAATVRVSAKVTLVPFAARSAGVTAPERFSRSDAAWAVPWLLIIVVAVLILGAWAYRRHRHRRAASRPVAVSGA